jgi:argininosuccinate lyase
LLATDLADYLVERGVPFRSAHHYIGELVAISEKKKVLLPDLEQSEALNICSELGDDWRDVFDLSRAFKMRERPGMPGPNQLKGRIEHWEKLLLT